MEWPVWADLFVRSAILLLSAQGLGRLHNRSTAADRRNLLLFVFAFLASLPFLSALAPSIHVPVWPGHTMEANVSIETAVLLRASAEGTGSRWPAENWLFAIWLSGALAVLAFLTTGRLVLWRVSRRAAPVCDASWTDLLGELSTRFGLKRTPLMLALDGLTTPLAFGIRHPTILLPGNCAEWPDVRKRVVLLHELAHIKRWDVAAQWFASVTAAIWWFQPLAWVARRTLRRESEQACDAEAIARGVRPCDYAAELIEMARSGAPGSAWSRAAIAMARPRDLEGRLIRILNPSSRLHARNRSLAALAALTVIALTASAVSLSSKERIPHLGGLLMKRTLFSGLVTSIGLSAATINGSVFDPIGAPVADAKVSISEPDTSVKQESVSASNGKFTLDNLPAGQYILRIEKPGFTPLLREFTLQQGSNLERSFGMQAASVNKDAGVENKDAVTMLSGSATARVRVGGEMMQAKLVTKIQPVYPKSAKADRIQGAVLLDAIVLKDGTLGEINVVSSPSDVLSEASLEAVRQWRYSPVLLNGEPIEVVTNVIVNFTLVQ
ncbi:MAG: M56 family metallopeptidase [Bryobacteraceae bacterium]